MDKIMYSYLKLGSEGLKTINNFFKSSFMLIISIVIVKLC